jgi:hypothetical protein
VTLNEHIHSKILAALESIPSGDRSDIYVVSLYVSDIDDDPRRPTIAVGYNTERRAAASTPAPGQKPKWPIASDDVEAKWNYAFWLQNSLAVIADESTDPAGAEAREAWARQKGFWFSDAEEERDFKAALEKVKPMTHEFVQMVVGVVQDLHRTGEVGRIFGRPVPLLIHELEYYDQIAQQNESANPPELVHEFSRWVRSS